MEIIKAPEWTFYVEGNPSFDDSKVGKWMYFFNDLDFARKICIEAVKSGVVQEAKHSDNIEGVCCFYLDCDDIQTHKRVIQFLLDNNLIKKTKAGKLYNMSFKFDKQTSSGEYGKEFQSEIKLDRFIDLYTGAWIQ